jgi:hypothetical protein
MKCPTTGCDEQLALHARKKYCHKCRHVMAYWSPGNKRPAEVVEAIASRTRSLFRLGHIDERKDDLIGLRRRPRRATK